MHQNDNVRKKRRLRGDTLILVTVFLVALFGFAALSIDVSNVFQKQRAANIGTDAASYAAVLLLTNSPQNAGSVTVEATAVADANGVTAAEIAASSQAVVQVGFWNTNTSTFVANATGSNGRWNAVSVPARRAVPLAFGKVVGIGQMNPAVHSVSSLLPAGTVNNAVPFGVTLQQVTGKMFGDTMLLNSDDVGSGKQGKLDLGSYQNTGDWKADMTTNGCNCTVSVGPVPTISGNAQVKQSFEDLGVGAIVVIPVVTDISFSGGSGTATIVGFVLVQITDFTGSGSNWSAVVTFLNLVVGSGGGGGCLEPCVSARALVE